jgi:hypothetical protein
LCGKTTAAEIWERVVRFSPACLIEHHLFGKPLSTFPYHAPKTDYFRPLKRFAIDPLVIDRQLLPILQCAELERRTRSRANSFTGRGNILVVILCAFEIARGLSALFALSVPLSRCHSLQPMRNAEAR